MTEQQGSGTETHQPVERRHRADSWVMVLRAFGIVGYLGLLAALFLYDQAHPQRSVIDERLLNGLNLTVDLRRTWDFDLAQNIFYLMLLGVFLGGFGLVLSARRNRRADDSYRLYLTLLTMISLAGVLLYLTRMQF
ncbi:MAG: hypothetical protein HY940_09480 [Gammaproteobacteria bacterium]|nr:hypothetical protein [Gammaproteobacteria bacterium]